MFFKQKRAYEMRMSDWSSDVCSSDQIEQVQRVDDHLHVGGALALGDVELLLRLDRVAVCDPAPALERRFLPVAVGTADVDCAELRQDGQNRVERIGRRVVGVYQERDVGGGDRKSTRLNSSH